MKAVAQVVKQARVKAKGVVSGEIDHGLLVFLAVHKEDTEDNASKMARKLTKLKIFDNSEGKLKRSIRDVEGKILLIPQFTLYGDCRKGATPDFSDAAPPKKGKDLYQRLIRDLRDRGIPVETGQFGEFMEIDSINTGPITIIINT